MSYCMPNFFIIDVKLLEHKQTLASDVICVSMLNLCNLILNFIAVMKVNAILSYS